MKKFVCLILVLASVITCFGLKYGNCLLKEGSYRIVPYCGQTCGLLPFMVGSDENYRVGFVANTGKLAVVFEPQFEDIVLDVVDGFFIVKKNGKWGTVDGNRYRMAAECIYDGVSQWRKDENGEYVATVRKDGKIYRINRNGEKL